MYYVIEIQSKHLSRVIGRKQLKVIDGLVWHQGEPVRCRWCQWSPRPEDITGADGLMLGGFTKVNWLAQLGKWKHYRLAIHSCRNGVALPLTSITLGAEA